jgi:hypothetical protein
MTRTVRDGFSVDPFLDRVQTREYNCLDFTREVWLDMTGEDITARLTGLVGAFVDRKPNLSGVKSFKRLPGPISPCIVVMQRFHFIPHVGIFWNGRILHLTNRGVQFQPLVVARQYFISVKYYE